MAVAVVEAREMVEVDQCDGAGQAAARQARDFLVQHAHDAAAVERAGQFIKLGEFLDPLVGFLQLQPALVKRSLQRAGEDAEEHAATDGDDERRHGGKAFEMAAMRHGERLVGEEKQAGQAQRHHSPEHSGLDRRRAQRGEAEDGEERAQEHHADFRRDVGEGEQDHHVGGRAGRDQVMILEALVEADFRQQDVDSHQGQAAQRVGRAHPDRDGAGIGVDQEDAGVDDIADADHALNLAALLGAARQRLGRVQRGRNLDVGRNRIQERWRAATHDFAVVGNSAKIYVGKPLGLVSLDPPSAPSKPGYCYCFSTEIGCGRAPPEPTQTKPSQRVFAPTALAAKAWYGRTGRRLKVLEYYDTESRGGWLASDAWAEIWRPSVGYVTYAFSELR